LHGGDKISRRRLTKIAARLTIRLFGDREARWFRGGTLVDDLHRLTA
jgi:hypothetical protein